jgi:hypothetical protein
MSEAVILQVVLTREQALALWADGSWEGRQTGPAFTAQAIVQGIVETATVKPLALFGPALERIAPKYDAAHAGMPSGDAQPPAVLIVNLPAVEPPAPPLSPQEPAGVLQTVEDADL